jgi:hypothetical protein
MPTGQRRLRPWRRSGLYNNKKPLTPAQQQAALDLRQRLIDQHLGGDASPAQSIVLGLITSAVLRHNSVASWLRDQPGPWVDARGRRAWSILTDLGQMERHVARLIQVLVDPALARRPVEVEDVRQRYGIDG